MPGKWLTPAGNPYCVPANLFSLFVMEYLISTNSFGKSQMDFWKYIHLKVGVKAVSWNKDG